jgi:hypothetical protein
MKRAKTKSILILITAALVTACTLRFIFLPAVLTSHINSKLDSLETITIRYDDFSISLLTASYTIHDVQLIRKETKAPFPFFEAEKINVSLDWNALLKGFWVSRIHVKDPSINFIKDTNQANGNINISPEWTQTARDIIFLPVNTITIDGGEIQYYDFNITPKTILSITDVTLNANNLYNVQGEDKMLSGNAEGSGKVMGASIRMNLELNTFYKVPMFNLNAELTDLNLDDIKDFLHAYGKSETQQGIFSLFTQASTRNNKIVGYVKPLIEDVTIASLELRDHASGLSRLSSEGAKTPSSFTYASGKTLNEIEFEGSLKDGTMNLWNAVALTLHNAFVEALVSMMEKTVASPQGKNNPSIRPKQDPSSKLSKKNSAPKGKGFLKRMFKGQETARKKKSRKE